MKSSTPMSVCRRMARKVPRSSSRCAGTTVCANGLSRLIMIWLPCCRRTRKPNLSSTATTCYPETRGNLLIQPTTALPACPLARAGRLPARQQCNLQSPPECSGSIPHAWRLGTRNRAGSGTPPPSSRPRRDESEPVACLKGMNAPAVCQVVPVAIARLRRFNAEAQRFAESRRDFCLSAFLRVPLRLCVDTSLALVAALPRRVLATWRLYVNCPC